MPERGARLRHLLSELQRRKVIRVAIAYGAGAFAIVQVAAAAFPALHLPSAAVTLVVVLAILGFPLALLLSWAYDITPDRGGVSDLPEKAPSSSTRPASASATAIPEIAAQPAADPGSAPTLDELPTPLTEFVGRQAELDAIGVLLRSPKRRLLTICGPGGIGKTRLALEAAAIHRDLFPHGICFVPLSSLDSAGPLVSTIAGHLKLALTSGEESKQQLLDYLRSKSLLLVLDNFEHLAPAAVLLSEVLEHAPATRILVTSRERLNLQGETLLPLEGLQIPPAELAPDIDRYEAVQLFVQCARRVQPRFGVEGEEGRAVVRICELVGGVPLGLELAAAWAHVLPCTEIADAIQRDRDFLSASFRDLPERHRSLRSVFESAWRLLAEEEKTAYGRLAVFRGGFTRDAAQKVTKTRFPLLSALLDKSLMRRAASGRFEILEVLRQFAEEKLQTDPLECSQVQQLHMEYYAELLRRVHDPAGAAGERQPVEVEIENCRAAWHHAIRTRQLKPIEQSLDALFTFYDAHGWAREGEEMFAAAAAALSGRKPIGDSDPATRDLVLARLLVRHGAFCTYLGLNLKARELLDRGLAQFRKAGDRRETAFALDQLGNILTKEGRSLEAKRLYAESMSIYRELGDMQSIGRLATHLGNAALGLGEYEEARGLYHESVAILNRSGDRSGLAAPLRNLGVIAAIQEAYAEADEFFLESLEIDRQLNNQRGIAHSLQNLGLSAVRAGQFEQAEAYLNEAVAVSSELGFRRLLAFCLNALGEVAASRNDSPRARQHYHQALAITTEISETPLILEVLLGIARLRKEAAEHEGAVELLALIRHHPATERDSREAANELVSELSGQLPIEILQPAIERGESLELEVAARRVLEDAAFFSLAPMK